MMSIFKFVPEEIIVPGIVAVVSGVVSSVVSCKLSKGKVLKAVQREENEALSFVLTKTDDLGCYMGEIITHAGYRITFACNEEDYQMFINKITENKPCCESCEPQVLKRKEEKVKTLLEKVPEERRVKLIGKETIKQTNFNMELRIENSYDLYCGNHNIGCISSGMVPMDLETIIIDSKKLITLSY